MSRAADSGEHIYHLGDVAATDVNFSPDSQILAVATGSAAIELHAAATGDPLGDPILAHTNIVWSVEFSPDGKRMASSSRDTTIRIWDVASRTMLAQLVGSADEVRCVAFSPDGQWLISTGDEGTVRLWDMNTFQLVGVPLQNHFDEDGYGEGYRLAFAPDGQTLASAGGDAEWLPSGHLHLWQVASGRLRAALHGHRQVVRTVAFSPDGRTLASGSSDGLIKLWDVASGQDRATWASHADRVLAVAFAPDRATLATAGADQTVKLWDAQRGTQQATLRGMTVLWLETGIHQPEALRLYERAGYVRREPFGSYQPDSLSVFMEKRLLTEH